MQISLAEIEGVGAWGRVVQAPVREKGGQESRYRIASNLLNYLKELGLYYEGKIEQVKGIEMRFIIISVSCSSLIFLLPISIFELLLCARK